MNAAYLTRNQRLSAIQLLFIAQQQASDKSGVAVLATLEYAVHLAKHGISDDVVSELEYVRTPYDMAQK
jgi:hypothetical protein